jgi:hypothetical protein
MGAVNFRTAAAGFVLGLLALAATAPLEVRAQDLDPAAVQILRRMTDYLGSLQGFSLDTQSTYEDVLDSGQKIQFDLSTSVVVQRPNKLRGERKGDFGRQVIVYDGKTLTVFNEKNKLYAVKAVPDNLDDMLHFARDSLDLVPPAGDMVFTNAFELLTAPVTSAMVVGKSIIGGVSCDHIAFSGPVVDFQIWIAEAGKPLPRKYVITTRDDPAQPQYMMLMSNWNVAPKLNDSMFRFKLPQGATEVDFTQLDASR